MIRPATIDDLPTLQNLVTGFFANGELDGTGLTVDADTVEFFIRDNLEDGTRCVLVAEVEGEIVGAIAGGVAPWWGNFNIITLFELGWFIPKESRGKYPKAALGLKRQFQKWGKEQGATVLIMASTEREESSRVRQMYEKTGLRLIDYNFIGPL